jgi:hypothetical protein
MERAAIWACKRENYQQYVLYIFIAKIYHYGERFIVNGHDQLTLSSQLIAQGRRLILLISLDARSESCAAQGGMPGLARLTSGRAVCRPYKVYLESSKLILQGGPTFVLLFYLSQIPLPFIRFSQQLIGLFRAFEPGRGNWIILAFGL